MLIFFLLTHPGQRRRRHSGDSAYWRRPRDGGRQNKEQQEAHDAPTRAGLHIYLTHREFLFYTFFCFDISLVAVVWL